MGIMNTMKKNAINSLVIMGVGYGIKKLLEVQVGKGANAGYNPKTDEIGFINTVGPIPVGFTADEKGVKKINSDVYAHERGHRYRFKKYGTATITIMRHIPGGKLLDEICAWRIANKIQKGNINKKVMITALSTYVVATTFEIWQWKKTINWVQKKFNKEGK